LPLRAALALALRAAATEGLSEGVCHHFSVALPSRDDGFLLCPRGLRGGQVRAPNIVLCNPGGEQLAGNRRAVTRCSPRPFHKH
jgi:ribulose-5-phosphate 4-epimerase/fuculose-1-phosphate aldolase